MELDVERHERITAPVLLVWEEMGSLDVILAKSPQVVAYDVVPGIQRATIKANLAWGPVKWTVLGEARVEETRPRERLHYVIEFPRLGMRFLATMDLSEAGSSDSRLVYRGVLDVRHRMASRMRGMFSEVIEEHMHGIVTRVKIRAEQRRMAQERLLR